MNGRKGMLVVAALAVCCATSPALAEQQGRAGGLAPYDGSFLLEPSKSGSFKVGLTVAELYGIVDHSTVTLTDLFEEVRCVGLRAIPKVVPGQTGHSAPPIQNPRRHRCRIDARRMERFPNEEQAFLVFNTRFSHENDLRRLGLIRVALGSFRTITRQYRDRFTQDERRQVGNTSGEAQGLGFPSWLSSVKGTLRKQEYELQQMRYERAERRSATGEIDVDELSQMRDVLKTTESELQDFWNTFRISN
jgi:hypothetical protein